MHVHLPNTIYLDSRVFDYAVLLFPELIFLRLEILRALRRVSNLIYLLSSLCFSILTVTSPLHQYKSSMITWYDHHGTTDYDRTMVNDVNHGCTMVETHGSRILFHLGLPSYKSGGTKTKSPETK